MKSHESIHLLDLLAEIYKDVCERCDACQPQTLDLKTIRSRVEAEGMSFLTITLPDLGKDFERSLDQGFIDSTSFRSFKKRAKIPAFLQGLFSRIFDMWSGRLYEYPRVDICAIDGIRQLAYAFKKLSVPCSLERERRAVSEYKQSELCFNEPVTHERQDHFDHVCDLLWPSVIGFINPYDTIPKHGPGATAERVRSNRKYIAKRWHDRLEGYFPLLSFAFHNENATDSEDFENVTVVPSAQEQPVRVVLVPKTLKAPRVIAIEPVCMQYAQQAISRALIKVLESSELTAGHVNFRDQTVNQRMALTSSRDGRFATLDLSSASDRVPRELALNMFRSNPSLMEAIDACRSMSATTPDGDVIRLKKFASMGSALCFPVESMYFYTICIGALLSKHDLPVTFLNIRKVAKKVYIYGDDIIVPADDASFVADYLQQYYCKVNTSKSFWVGKFRESCGVDAYDGVEVTPTYVRHLRPSNKREAKALISWVATCNHFYKRGYWHAASHMMKICEMILGKLPIVKETSPALGWISFQNWYSTDRWSKTIHCSEVRAWVAKPVYIKDHIDGYPALLKSLLNLETSNDLESDSLHLERSARHGVATLKRRWVRPF